MAIYPSSDRQFLVGEIIRLAYIDARLVGMHTTPDTNQMQYGRDKLDLILDRLPASAPTVRQSRMDTVTAEPMVGEYSLGDDVVGVPGPAFWVGPTDDADSPEERLELAIVGMAGWHSKAQGDSFGDPSMVWPELGVAPPRVHLWPVPELGGTLQIKVTRLLADAGPGENTLDVARLWVPYLQRALAAELCRQRSAQEAATMRLEAEAMLTELNRVDGESSVCTVKWTRTNRWRQL